MPFSHVTPVGLLQGHSNSRDWNSPCVTSCPCLGSPCARAHFVTFLMAILKTVDHLGHAEIPSATSIRWDILYWEWLKIQHKLVKKWKEIIGSINWKDRKRELRQIQLDCTIFLLCHLHKRGPQAPGSPFTEQSDGNSSRRHSLSQSHPLTERGSPSMDPQRKGKDAFFCKLRQMPAWVPLSDCVNCRPRGENRDLGEWLLPWQKTVKTYR